MSGKKDWTGKRRDTQVGGGGGGGGGRKVHARGSREEGGDAE